MPRAPHRVANHETVGERTVVVRAMRRDRKNVVSPPHQKDVFSAKMTDEHFAVGKLIKTNTLGKIGSLLRILRVAHRNSLPEFLAYVAVM
jgi:hypothetical protein